MGQSTDWFIAHVDEAAEMGCALPDELIDTWKNVSIRDVLELELEELAKVICGPKFVYRPDLIYPEDAAADAGPSVTSEVFEGGTFVTLVPDQFIRALAAIRDADLVTIASVWQSKTEHMRDWAPIEVSGVLQTMRDFAALSIASQKSVLSIFEA